MWCGGVARLLSERSAGTPNELKQVVEGPVTFMCPASLLQKQPHAKLYLNQAAAAELRPR